MKGQDPLAAMEARLKAVQEKKPSNLAGLLAGLGTKEPTIDVDAIVEKTRREAAVEFQEVVDQLTNKVKNQRSTIITLNEELDGFYADNGALREALEAAEKKNALLKQQEADVVSLTSEVSREHTENRILSEKLTEAQHTLSIRDELIASIGSVHVSVNDEVETLTAQRSSEELQRLAAQKEVRELKTSFATTKSSHQEELFAKDRDLTKALKQIAAFETERAKQSDFLAQQELTRQTEMAAVKRTLDEQAQEINRLRAENAANDKRLTDFGKTVDALVPQLERGARAVDLVSQVFPQALGISTANVENLLEGRELDLDGTRSPAPKSQAVRNKEAASLLNFDASLLDSPEDVKVRRPRTQLTRADSEVTDRKMGDRVVRRPEPTSANVANDEGTAPGKFTSFINSSKAASAGGAAQRK